MAETKLGINIPPQSIIYTGLCLIGVLLSYSWGSFRPAVLWWNWTRRSPTPGIGWKNRKR